MKIDQLFNKLRIRTLVLVIVVCMAVTAFYYFNIQWGWGFSVISLLLLGFAGMGVQEKNARSDGNMSSNAISASYEGEKTQCDMSQQRSTTYTLDLIDPGSDPVAILRLMQDSIGLTSSKSKSLLMNKQFPVQIVYGDKKNINSSALLLQKAGAIIKIGKTIAET